jgi:hypothetical protein
MVTSTRSLVLVLTLLLTVVLVPVSTVRGAGNIVVATPKAPVVADGDVTGRPTDINLVLDRSLDPQVAGRTLLTGRTISVTLADAFARTDVPVKAPESGALVKGWPQGGLEGYTVTLAGMHTVVFTATDDIVPRRVSITSERASYRIHRPSRRRANSTPRPVPSRSAARSA